MQHINLISIRPPFKNDIIKMLVLDFITRQDDRHLSNMAIKVTADGEQFYPLYDNGRSLFYEDTEETVGLACEDIESYCTTFGFEGTYLDHLRNIATSGVCLSDLVNLEISEEQIRNTLIESGFKGYRLEGAVRWITGAIDIVRSL